MFIYNITIKVDTRVADMWLDWMLTIHIPEVLRTGCFNKHQVLKLINIDENDGPTYAVQYYAESLEKYNHYIEHYAASLRQKGIAKWGDQFVAFRSIMKVIN